MCISRQSMIDHRASHHGHHQSRAARPAAPTVSTSPPSTVPPALPQPPVLPPPPPTPLSVPFPPAAAVALISVANSLLIVQQPTPITATAVMPTTQGPPPKTPSPQPPPSLIQRYFTQLNQLQQLEKEAYPVDAATDLSLTVCSNRA